MSSLTHLILHCCLGTPGTMRPRYVDPPLVEIVLDLGNPCQCYKCLKKTSSVLNKLDGVNELVYNLETNQITVIGTVNPDVVLRKICKVKKHAKVSAVTQCLPPPVNQHPPPPPHHSSVHIHIGEQGQGHGRSSRCHSHQHPHPQSNCGGNEVPQGKSSRCHSHQHPPTRSNCAVSGQCQGKSSRSHCHQHHAPQTNCVGNEIPPMQPMYCKGPPPSSTCHCPPPEANNPATANQVDNFLRGVSSSVVPRNAINMNILGKLAKVPNLKGFELKKKEVIKFSFQNGPVKSFHPTSCKKVKPGYQKHQHELPQRYVSPSSDENLNIQCAIM